MANISWTQQSAFTSLAESLREPTHPLAARTLLGLHWMEMTAQIEIAIMIGQYECQSLF